MTPSFLKWHTDSNAVGGALGRMSEYLVLNDPDPVIAAWATAVSVADSDGEPLWLMLVGPPSGSKTESIKTLARVTDAQFSEISTAGLLTQRPGKNGSQPRPATGLLPELGNDCNAFVTISDMSSLLTRGQAGSGRSGSTVSTVFDAFRDIYDGRYQRIQDGVKPSWEGRLTFLAGATTAIDEYGAHSKRAWPAMGLYAPPSAG